MKYKLLPVSWGTDVIHFRWIDLAAVWEASLMELEARSLGGRAYLVSKLRERGCSRRMAVRIVNMVFAEMSQALCRGEYVEFPFGYLKAEKGRRWEAPLTIEHIPDEEGWKLLEGETGLPWAPGWSRKVDKRSLVYLWDRALERDRKDR
jgi:hypothetical protein